MNKKYQKVVAAVISAALLTGCWDSAELQKHNIVITVIVERKEENVGFYVEIASLTAGESGGGGGGQTEQQKFEILHSQGGTLIQARDDLDRKSDHPIYLGATRAVVLTDSYSRFGIEEYMNRMRGDIYYRKPVLLATTSTEPEKMLKDRPENSPSIGDAIENTLDNLDKNGEACSVTVGYVLEALAVKTVGFYLPDVNIEEKENTLSGYSVFKDAKKIGTIDAKERQGLVYLTCRDAKLSYVINYKGREITFSAKMAKRKIKPVFQDGKVRFTVDISVGAEYEYIDRTGQFEKKEIDDILRLLESKIRDDLLKTLDTARKEYRCDYLNFYKYFRAKYPKEFRQMNWNEVFAQSGILVEVKAKFKEASMIEILKQE